MAVGRPSAPPVTQRGARGRCREHPFDTDTLTLKTGAQTVIHFENRGGPSVQHNVAIYENSDAQGPIFQGDIIPGDTDADYEFTAPPSGEYFFRCDIHPSMNGTVVVES